MQLFLSNNTTVTKWLNALRPGFFLGGADFGLFWPRLAVGAAADLATLGSEITFAHC